MSFIMDEVEENDDDNKSSETEEDGSVDNTSEIEEDKPKRNLCDNLQEWCS